MAGAGKAPRFGKGLVKHPREARPCKRSAASFMQPAVDANRWLRKRIKPRSAASP